MRLSRVETRHFRNLANQALEIPPEGVAIVGANAQGKSNFLEALYYLETFRSFRGARNDQMLAFGQDVFRIAGTIESDGETGGREVAAAYQRTGRRRKITVDGAEPERIIDALGHVAAVVFSPSDVAIVTDGPSARRHYLDVVLSLNAPGYVVQLQRFRHALSQRNAALKCGGSGDLVGVWDAPLVHAGARIMEDRRRWVEAWCDAFRSYYEAVSGGRPATLRYRPNVDVAGCEDVADIEAAFGAALDASGATELRMKTTMVGPQRDDLVISLEGENLDLDVRDFGSGGQRRTAALALRLIESDTIRASRGRTPVVLLDDAFAELDEARSERVLGLLARDRAGQVIVTAPKRSDVRLRAQELPVWTIAEGRIDR